MNNLVTKKTLIILFFFGLGSINALKAKPSELLTRADSMFVAGQYTIAGHLYDSLLNHLNYYNQSVLLKMAFIAEGLDQYDRALYYLSMHNLTAPNKQVMRKMSNLAEAHNLKGYRFTDLAYFRLLYNKYYITIISAIVGLLVLLLLLLIIRRWRGAQIGLQPVVILVLSVVCLVAINAGSWYHQGVFTTQQVYVRQGPSAGAPVIEVAKPGHRVQLLGQKDVWQRIAWNGKEAWVHNRHILPVSITP